MPSSCRERGAEFAGKDGHGETLEVETSRTIFVEPGDVPALRAALVRLLGDADLRRRFGDAGRERARERLSWDAVTAATLAAYRDAIG